MKPRIRISSNQEIYKKTLETVQAKKLHTVCEEAACPNIQECWNKSHASFMILGSTCTRSCAFCNVATGVPDAVDKDEPERVALAVKDMNLKHVVVTSVDRDDLPDGGAEHFAQTIAAIRKISPRTTIEVLTPDFLRKKDCAQIVYKAKPDVFNHNIETVPSLYPAIRPGSRYFNSLLLLKNAKEYDSSIFTKSGLMLGLGETRAEVLQVMDDLISADVDFITIGQYLRPTNKHAEVKNYATDEDFDFFARMAKIKGFKMVSSSALTRSSYHADEDFAELVANMKK